MGQVIHQILLSKNELGFQGYATEPIVVNGVNLYFRGETILKSVIEEVLPIMERSTQVLVSGCSAGGEATLEWVQYFRDILPESTQVLAAPDSGMFQDMESFDPKAKPYREFYQQNFMQISNKGVDPPNQYCVQANPNEKWKCLISPYLLNYITVPVFFIQSNYDQWSIPNILKTNCVNDRTLKKCSVNQINYIELHHRNNFNIIQQRLAKDQQGGAWVPSCVNHCFLHEDSRFTADYYRVPSGNGATLSQAMVGWVLRLEGQNTHIDYINWPGNQGCATI